MITAKDARKLTNDAVDKKKWKEILVDIDLKIQIKANDGIATLDYSMVSDAQHYICEELKTAGYNVQIMPSPYMASNISIWW